MQLDTLALPVLTTNPVNWEFLLLTRLPNHVWSLTSELRNSIAFAKQEILSKPQDYQRYDIQVARLNTIMLSNVKTRDKGQYLTYLALGLQQQELLTYMYSRLDNKVSYTGPAKDQMLEMHRLLTYVPTTYVDFLKHVLHGMALIGWFYRLAANKKLTVFANDKAIYYSLDECTWTNCRPLGKPKSVCPITLNHLHLRRLAFNPDRLIYDSEVLHLPPADIEWLRLIKQLPIAEKVVAADLHKQRCMILSEYVKSIPYAVYTVDQLEKLITVCHAVPKDMNGVITLLEDIQKVLK